MDRTDHEREVVDRPKHGTLGAVATDGSVTYTPDAAYEGPDSFRLVARGPGGESEPVTVAIDVRPAAPVCKGISLKTTEGEQLTVKLACEGKADRFEVKHADGAGIPVSADGTVTLPGVTTSYRYWATGPGGTSQWTSQWAPISVTAWPAYEPLPDR